MISLPEIFVLPYQTGFAPFQSKTFHRHIEKMLLVQQNYCKNIENDRVHPILLKLKISYHSFVNFCEHKSLLWNTKRHLLNGTALRKHIPFAHEWSNELLASYFCETICPAVLCHLGKFSKQDRGHYSLQHFGLQKAWLSLQPPISAFCERMLLFPYHLEFQGWDLWCGGERHLYFCSHF